MTEILDVFTLQQIQQLATNPTKAIRDGFRAIEQSGGNVAPDNPDVANLIDAAQTMGVITPSQATNITSGGTLTNPVIIKGI